MELLTVDECRKKVVRDDIRAGSIPRTTYYLLLSISVLIAGFGLITNSPAVVIGAMLVSPLMTPIFGISLGLVRGDMALLRTAFVAEFGGVVIAIGVAAILGMFPFSNEVTPEMLARTSPTLLDLLVATLAGMAGCLAMIDERISPVLPGIAMATSLTPPLAVSGLCLAFGAYVGAWGAFLLFFANFLAILAVSAVLFIVAGFVTREEMGSGLNVLKRFAGPAVGFIFVTVLLTHALIGIIGERRTTKAIEEILRKELGAERSTFVEKIIYKQKGDKIDVLASVSTPQVLSPKKIKQMQEVLDERLKLNVNLIMRCLITKDISSTGSTSAVVSRNLNGEFISTNLHPRVKLLQIAEQVLREMLEGYHGLYLDLYDLDLIELKQGNILIASMEGTRNLTPIEVAHFEEAVRKRLNDDRVRLLVLSKDMEGVSSKGKILYGSAHFDVVPEDAAIQKKLEAGIKDEIEKLKNMFAVSVDAAKIGGRWAVRAEVVGPEVLKPSQVLAIEKAVRKATGEKMTLHAWCRVELVVTGDRFVTREGYTKEQVEKRLGGEKLKEMK